eukprot:TRINITY_DN16220_c0_g1_i2.p1 TRINITY_DN16220_c0_g1~~TRINITY_DN16220_c0_g1_i2.p1  ORF type:complete len:459 (+),score=57.88 TRINITY_DN16220_c0_g1_i2:128-1504(+)
MIIYHKRLWGLQLLGRLYGSAFPRALPFALLSTGITLILKLVADHTDDSMANHKRFPGEDQWLLELWHHPYPYQTFAFVVGFIIIFRSNFGYARYMEGRTQFQLMTSKWADGVVLALNFDKYNQDEKDPMVKYKMTVFANTFVHLVSLLHGVASQTLRKDYDLDNLIIHNTEGDAPPKDPVNLRTQNKNYAKLRQSSPEDSADKKKQDVDYEFIGFSIFDVFLLRSGDQAMGTLHRAMPLTLVGGLNEDEKNALGEEIWEEGCKHGLHQGHLDALKHVYVPGPAERVHTVMNWVHQYIMERRQQGGLKIEPPIITRLYQVFSEGMLGFEQCRKFCDTPFPFPWAQAVLVFLLIYTVTVPFVIGAFVRSSWLAAIITFIAVLTYWTLNEVARDLEDPFWYDPNDLPLSYYQYAFNERLLVISRTVRPKSDTEKHILGSKSNMPILDSKEGLQVESYRSV